MAEHNPDQLTKAAWRCPVCGAAARLPANHLAVTCICGYVQYCFPARFGDRMAARLARLGMTPERYRQIKSLLKLASCCGCHERQQLLNKVR